MEPRSFVAGARSFSTVASGRCNLKRTPWRTAAQHNLAEAKLAEALALEKQGMFAAASVLLTMEQIQVSKGIDGAGVEATNENLVAIKKCFEQMHTVEARCRDQAKLRMQVFGMLYKQGDRPVRAWRAPSVAWVPPKGGTRPGNQGS